MYCREYVLSILANDILIAFLDCQRYQCSDRQKSNIILYIHNLHFFVHTKCTYKMYIQYCMFQLTDLKVRSAKPRSAILIIS